MPRRRRVKQNGTQCHKILLTSKPLNFPTSSFSPLCLRELRERSLPCAEGKKGTVKKNQGSTDTPLIPKLELLGQDKKKLKKTLF